MFHCSLERDTEGWNGMLYGFGINEGRKTNGVVY